jgi:hypothetical protein
LALAPQHAAEPSVLTPHEWWAPALTERNVPGGGEDSPSALSPQQTTAPLVLTPHAWEGPALTERKSPAGAAV